MPVLAIRYLPRNEPSCIVAPQERTIVMVKTPNYKQDKRRREDAQKKRNAEEQARQQARKKSVVAEPPPE
jgi:hypothetical protein